MTAAVVPIRAGLPLQQAVAGFLAAKKEKPNTHRAYKQVWEALIEEIGDPDVPLHALSAEQLTDAFTELWDDAAPSSWNQRRAAVRSLLSYGRRHGWPLGGLDLQVDNRTVSVDVDRAIPRANLERLWWQTGVPLREKLLWRMLYETGARASEILGADVGDVDQPNRTVRVSRKGSSIDRVPYETASARLLPRYLRGRTTGPLFLADGAPVQTRAPALADIDPVSGRGRLSYSRAARLFKEETSRLFGAPYTLHQLRHSRATHLIEDGVSPVIVMRLTGHRSARQFARYARPSAEAVQKALTHLDPARRA